MNPRTLLLIGALLTMAVSGVLLLDQDVSWGPQQTIFLECLLIAIVTLAPLALRILTRQHFDLLEPSFIFALLYVMMFVVRPLMLESSWLNDVMTTGMEVRQFFSLADSDVELTLGYALLGVLCFHLGHRSWRDPLSEPRPPVPVRPWSARRVTHITIFGVVFAGISGLLVLPIFGGIQNVFANLGRFRALLTGFGYQSLGIDLLVLIVLILWVEHLQGRRRWLFLPPMLISNGYYFLLGARSGIFNLWLFMFLAHRYLREREEAWDWKKAIAGTLIVVLAVFSAMSLAELRNVGVSSGRQAVDVVTTFWEQDPHQLVTNFMLEFDQFDIFALVVGMGPKQFPLMYGRSYLDVLLQPIPRGLWPNKPWSFDRTIGQLLTGTDTAIPPSMVGEMYMNFHVFGIVGGMLLFGWGSRRLYQLALMRPRDPGRIVLYALLLPFLPIFMLRAFIAVATTSLAYGIPCWLAIRYIQGEKKTKPRAAWMRP